MWPLTGNISGRFCMLRDHDEQNNIEIKSSTGENDAIKRCCKHEMFEAAAGIARHIVLQGNFFISSKRTH